MRKTLTFLATAVFALLLAPSAAMAQDGGAVMNLELGTLGKGLGVGLIILGASFGIGKIGSTAVESIARQPESAGPIGTNMIIAAALIEGVTVIALIMAIVV